MEDSVENHMIQTYFINGVNSVPYVWHVTSNYVKIKDVEKRVFLSGQSFLEKEKHSFKENIKISNWFDFIKRDIIPYDYTDSFIYCAKCSYYLDTFDINCSMDTHNNMTLYINENKAQGCVAKLLCNIMNSTDYMLRHEYQMSDSLTMGTYTFSVKLKTVSNEYELCRFFNAPLKSNVDIPQNESETIDKWLEAIHLTDTISYNSIDYFLYTALYLDGETRYKVDYKLESDKSHIMEVHSHNE